jgi:hypothetical protein
MKGYVGNNNYNNNINSRHNSKEEEEDEEAQLNKHTRLRLRDEPKIKANK